MSNGWCEKCLDSDINIFMDLRRCEQCGNGEHSGSEHHCKSCAIEMNQCQMCGLTLEAKEIPGPLYLPETYRWWTLKKGEDLAVNWVCEKTKEEAEAALPHFNDYEVVQVELRVVIDEQVRQD